MDSLRIPFCQLSKKLALRGYIFTRISFVFLPTRLENGAPRTYFYEDPLCISPKIPPKFALCGWISKTTSGEISPSEVAFVEGDGMGVTPQGSPEEGLGRTAKKRVRKEPSRGCLACLHANIKKIETRELFFVPSMYPTGNFLYYIKGDSL